MSKNADRTIIVTGAASGIGRGIAKRFGEEGDFVVVADIRREPKQGEYYDTNVTQPTDKMIQSETAGNGTFIETDVSDPESVQNMIEQVVSEKGAIDVLVNNAGVFVEANTEEITIEEWQQVTGVDLDGTFYCSKFAMPHLKQSEGNIINIGSVYSTEGGGVPSYAAAKAGVLNLTRDLAVELGPHNVNVNIICPGFIKTPIADYLDEEDIQATIDHIPLSHGGEPEDIGDAAVLLASDEASYIHGESLHVDGGWTSHRL